MSNKHQRAFLIRSSIVLSLWVMLLFMVVHVRSQTNIGASSDTFTKIVFFVVIYCIVHFAFWYIFNKLPNKNAVWPACCGLLSGISIYASMAIINGMFASAQLVPNLIAAAIISIGPIWSFLSLRG